MSLDTITLSAWDEQPARTAGRLTKLVEEKFSRIPGLLETLLFLRGWATLLPHLSTPSPHLVAVPFFTSQHLQPFLFFSCFLPCKNSHQVQVVR